MKVFLTTMAFLLACFSFSQVEIIEGKSLYKCGKDTVVLHIKTSPDLSSYQWYAPGVPFPFYYADTLPLTETYTSTQRTVVRVASALYNGIRYYDTINIVFWRDKPIIELDVTDSSICAGTGAVTTTDIAAGPAGYSYKWSNGLTGINTLSSDTAGVFTLRKTVFPTDCFSEATFTLKINPVPEIKLNALPAVCGPDTFEIVATVTPMTSTTKVSWTPSTGLEGIDSFTPKVYYDGTGQIDQKYFVTVTDEVSLCGGNMDSIHIVANPIPSISLSLSNQLTSYCDVDSVVLKSMVFDTLTYAYHWELNSTSIFTNEQAISVYADSKIVFKVEDKLTACEDEVDREILLRTSPLDLSLLAIDSIRNDEVLDLTLTGKYLEDELTWTTSGDTNLLLIIDSANATYDSQQMDEGIVSFTAKASNACGESESSIDVKFIQTLVPPDYILWIPNSFQPNNDNIEVAHLKVYGANVSEEEFEFKVYDKWGQVIFESEDFEEMNAEGWDGEGFSSDVYNYTLKSAFTNGDPIMEYGSITLIR